MALTPLLILLMCGSSIPMLGIFFSVLAFILFIAISITDYFDGKIARENNNVTNFGKLFDPIADKILVFSVLIMFVAQNKVSAIILILLLSREIVVLAIKQLLLEKEGNVIAASQLAKYKTVAQIVAIILIFLVPIHFFNTLPFYSLIVRFITTILLLPRLVLSYISMFDYIKMAKKYFVDDILK